MSVMINSVASKLNMEPSCVRNIVNVMFEKNLKYDDFDIVVNFIHEVLFIYYYHYLYFIFLAFMFNTFKINYIIYIIIIVIII
jgi:hypothetical protein